MKSSKSGVVLRRKTSAERRHMVASFHKSQMTQREFAAHNGIGLSTLSKWLRLERDTVPAKVKFHEIQLPEPTSRWPVEVVNPQGWVVRLQKGSDMQTLSQLLRALPC